MTVWIHTVSKYPAACFDAVLLYSIAGDNLLCLEMVSGTERCIFLLLCLHLTALAKLSA